MTCLNCDNTGSFVEVCPYCNGSGEGPHETLKCTECNGTGEKRYICHCEKGLEIQQEIVDEL